MNDTNFINKENYESFFLLYIDGELDPKEAAQVEAFLAANPELFDEFDNMRALVLPVDDLDQELSGFDKTQLYKDPSLSVNMDNLEEKFLDYHDGELCANGKKEVETFVLTHPDVQPNFLSLKQARLSKETIPFPDKRKLYKQQRAIVSQLLRWGSFSAVAASFLFSYIRLADMDSAFLNERAGQSNLEKHGKSEQNLLGSAQFKKVNYPSANSRYRHVVASGKDDNNDREEINRLETASLGFDETEIGYKPKAHHREPKTAALSPVQKGAIESFARHLPTKGIERPSLNPEEINALLSFYGPDPGNGVLEPNAPKLHADYQSEPGNNDISIGGLSIKREKLAKISYKFKKFAESQQDDGSKKIAFASFTLQR